LIPNLLRAAKSLADLTNAIACPQSPSNVVYRASRPVPVDELFAVRRAADYP